jgi:hypothetical protein
MFKKKHNLGFRLCTRCRNKQDYIRDRNKTAQPGRERLCKYCEKPNLGEYGAGIFCSQLCSKRYASAYTQTPILVVCMDCEKEFSTFERNKSQTKRCPACRKRARRKRQGLHGISKKEKCSKCQKNIGPTKHGMCKVCLYKDPEFRLKVKALSAGWHFRPRKMRSFPELFFERVIKNNRRRFKGEGYLPDYPVKKKSLGLINNGSYFLDFYFPNWKLDLEIDGSQHWQYEERIQSDITRDIALKANGIKVYRIPWPGVEKKEVLSMEIEKFLSYVDELS